jgi:hypothetical protein
MTIPLQDNETSSLAALVAPEDLCRGDFVAILSEIVELPSFLWSDSFTSGPEELVRVRRLPTEDRTPLKVKAVCLPFVFVKLPSGRFETIDIRLASLVRLEKAYAKRVWKAHKARTKKLTAAR